MYLLNIQDQLQPVQLLVWANDIKCELMLLKCQINTNTKNFLHPTKCFERMLKYSYLVSIILNYQFPKIMLVDIFVLILDFNTISSRFNSINSSQ